MGAVPAAMNTCCELMSTGGASGSGVDWREREGEGDCRASVARKKGTLRPLLRPRGRAGEKEIVGRERLAMSGEEDSI